MGASIRRAPAELELALGIGDPNHWLQGGRGLGKPRGLGIGNDVKKSWGKSEHILKSSRNAWGTPRCF